MGRALLCCRRADKRVDEAAPNATCQTLAMAGPLLHKETGCGESSLLDVTSDFGPTSGLSIAEAECIHQKCRHLMVMAAVENT